MFSRRSNEVHLESFDALYKVKYYPKKPQNVFFCNNQTMSTSNLHTPQHGHQHDQRSIFAPPPPNPIFIIFSVFGSVHVFTFDKGDLFFFSSSSTQRNGTGVSAIDPLSLVTFASLTNALCCFCRFRWQEVKSFPQEAGVQERYTS